jgi:two-component system response regulator DegU
MGRILLVDDHAPFRQAFRRIIQLKNPLATLEEAVDGNEALQNVDAIHPDLIFMDVGLPGESGLQITMKIRKRYPGITIVVLTGHNKESYQETAFECGANYFISKNELNWDEIDALIKRFTA